MTDILLPAPIARVFERARRSNTPSGWAEFRRVWFEILGPPTRGTAEQIEAEFTSAIQLLSGRAN